jgi:hypothetical protein
MLALVAVQGIPEHLEIPVSPETMALAETAALRVGWETPAIPDHLETLELAAVAAVDVVVECIIFLALLQRELQLLVLLVPALLEPQGSLFRGAGMVALGPQEVTARPIHLARRGIPVTPGRLEHLEQQVRLETPVGLGIRVQQVQTVAPEAQGLQVLVLHRVHQAPPAVPQILQTQTHLL